MAIARALLRHPRPLLVDEAIMADRIIVMDACCSAAGTTATGWPSPATLVRKVRTAPPNP